MLQLLEVNSLPYRKDSSQVVRNLQARAMPYRDEDIENVFNIEWFIQNGIPINASVRAGILADGG